MPKTLDARVQEILGGYQLDILRLQTQVEELAAKPAFGVSALSACRKLVEFHTQTFATGRPLSIDGVEIDHSLLNRAAEEAKDAIKKADGEP